MKNSSLIKKILYILVFLLIISGILLRFYNLRYHTQFDWDQENSVAYPARNILVTGKLPLIGAKTGITDLYLAPLYSYLAAIVYSAFEMDPVAGAYLGALISVVTLLIGYLLTKKIFGQNIAYLFTLFWSTSPLVIMFDRIPWNVNLLPLASMLTIWGLLAIINGSTSFALSDYKRVTGARYPSELKLLRVNPALVPSLTREALREKDLINNVKVVGRKKYGWILIGIGFLLGVNSHYSIILIMLLVVLFSIYKRKILDKSVIWTLLFLFIGVAPLLVFYFRHPQILSQSLNSLSQASLVNFPVSITRYGEILKYLAEFQASIIFPDISSSLKIIFFLFFIISLYLLKKTKQAGNLLKVFFFLWISYLLGFSIYRGPVPDYYFIGLLPITLLGIAIICEYLFNLSRFFLLFIVIFCSLNIFQSFLSLRTLNKYSLGMKQDLVKTIKNNSQDQETAVIFDMELGHSFGYGYLFDYYGLNIVPKEKTKNIYWISYPPQRFPAKPDFTYGDIALGLPQTAKSILETKGILLFGKLFSLRVTKNWSVIQCESQDFDRYLLTANENASCATLAKEGTGIVVDSIPSCTLNQFTEVLGEDLKQLEGFHQVYNSGNLTPLRRGYSYIIVLEQNRCVAFSDLSNLNEATISNTLKNILVSLRSNP